MLFRSCRKQASVVGRQGFTGTRDFSPVLAAPAAVEYRQRWRSGAGRSHAQYNAEGLGAAAAMLSEAWGTGLPTPPEMSRVKPTVV